MTVCKGLGEVVVVVVVVLVLWGPRGGKGSGASGTQRAESPSNRRSDPAS